MDFLVQVDQLSKSYGRKKVLDSVSFTCHKGINALLGPNGAGKTTLINILAGLDKNFDGKILFNNKQINFENYPIGQVGFLSQNFDMFHTLTGKDFLKYVYRMKNYPKEQEKEYLDTIIQVLSLESVINKKIGKYSGGFRQRLGIAQAYIGDPKFVILDEPTVGLDPEQREYFRGLLMKLSESTTTLISTHIIEDVEIFNANLLLLKNNRISFQGDINLFINQSKAHIYSITLPINEIDRINPEQIVEKKRINNEEVSIKYIPKAGKVLDKSHQNHDVTLENAYVYYQKS